MVSVLCGRWVGETLGVVEEVDWGMGKKYEMAFRTQMSLENMHL